VRAVDFKNATWTFVYWIFMLVAGSVYLIVQEFPVHLPFLNEETLFIAVVELALVFIYLIWPLLLPGTLRDSQGSKDDILNVLMQIMVMMLFALPVMMIAQNLSDAPHGVFLAAFALILGSASLVGGVYLMGRSFRIQIAPYYFLVLFVTQAMLPYFGYLVHEVVGGDPSGFVGTFSPFISALHLRTSGAALGQAAVFLTLAVAMGVTLHLRDRKLVAQAG
jgi:hypothetical protein